MSTFGLADLGAIVGTIGFFSSWAFVHRIYGSIKID